MIAGIRSSCRNRLYPRCARHGQHGDVVFLAELLCGDCDFLSGPMAALARALEAEEFPRCVAGLDHSVGQEGEGFAGGEVEGCLGITGAGSNAEGKCRI